jgi:hypothetical protein
MPGSAIHHLERNLALKDIQVLPSMDSMIDIRSSGWKPLEEETQVDMDAVNGYNDTFRPTNRPWFRQFFRTRQHPSLRPLPLSPSTYLQRMNRDIERLSVSIASGVDSAEKWKEFCTNGGGVSSLLQCIHSAADELELEYAQGVDSYSVDGPMERREEAFSMVGSTCKVLRNLCARDSNWAAMVTDDILKADQTCLSKSKENVEHQRIITDLVRILKYANEADLFYSRKGSRKARRKMRDTGYSIKQFGTRRQRRGKSPSAFDFCSHPIW